MSPLINLTIATQCIRARDNLWITLWAIKARNIRVIKGHPLVCLFALFLIVVDNMKRVGTYLIHVCYVMSPV